MSSKQVPGCPRCVQHVALWMVTFADMSSLLMAFFVLLVVMMPHQTEDSKSQAAAASPYQGNIGILDGGNTFSKGSLADMGMNLESLPSNSNGSNFGQAQTKAATVLRQEMAGNKLSIRPTKDGFAIDLLGSSYFKPGSSELLPETKKVLDKIGSLTIDLQRLGINNLVKVKGFSDAGIIASGSVNYTNNLALSSKRANNVVEYFWNLGINPTRQHEGAILAKFQSIGYGEFQPIEPNISPEQRATNRKIEIEFLRDPDAR